MFRFAVFLAISSLALSAASAQEGRGKKLKVPDVLPMIRTDQRQVKISFERTNYGSNCSVRLFALWVVDFDLRRSMGDEKWTLIAEVEPKADSATFKAPGNGRFWIGVQIVRENGALEPANLGEIMPMIVVIVQSQK
jgi:hypothetical protein